MTSYQKALKFVQLKHAGQMRAGESPTWLHLLRVSRILEDVFKMHKEGSAQEQKIIVQAALGHDLLEDTDATRAEVVKVFGPIGAELIKGMTNSKGDDDVADYVKDMARAREETRMIKLADLYDNISHVTYTLPLLGNDWAHNYFLPIVDPMNNAISKTRFIKFKKSSAFLIYAIRLSMKLLKEELGNYSKN